MKTVLPAVVGVTLALAVIAAGAAAAPKDGQVAFSIESNTLAEALDQWAKQTGYQLFSPDWAIAQHLTAPKLEGSLTPQAALEALLLGTPLTYSWIDSRTVAIRRVRLPAAASPHADNATPERRLPPESHPLDEVVVTGTNIRGREPGFEPKLAFTLDDIQRQGHASLPDLFQSLPQNLSEITPPSAVSIGASRIATSNVVFATGVSLRGLGPGSTLVLLNGQRRPGSIEGRAFDISAIPLSAIERIDVVTGGNSAVYGSDAVAGVVNVVTRREFSGAESHVYYGTGDAGGARLQLSQIFGLRAESGGLTVAYDYSHDDDLDATDAGVTRLSRFGLLPLAGRFDLSPEVERHSALFSGSLSLDENIQLSVDGQYTHIDNEHNQSLLAPAIPGFVLTQAQTNTSEEFSVAPALGVRLGDLWKLTTSAVYGRTGNDLALTSGSDIPRVSEEAKLSSLTAILDGTLFSTKAAAIKGAFGAESRWESLQYQRIHQARKAQSAFAEILLGMLPRDDGSQDTLQVSLSGRHSDYSDFGDSTDPQFAVRWSPLADVGIKAAYAKAFRAPDLYVANDAGQQASITVPVPDPLATSGASPLLVRLGNNSALRPEKAETWSFGLDYGSPARVRASLEYFGIDYDGRIDVPTSVLLAALADANRFPGLVQRNPTAADIAAIAHSVADSGGIANESGVPFDPATQDLLAVFPDLVVFDDRFHNVALERVRGFDLLVDGSIDVGSASLPFGFNGTYYSSIDRRLGAGATATRELDVPGKPPRLRARGYFGWTRDRFQVNAYFNYSDGYTDPNLDPAVSVDAWLTTDLVLRYRASGETQRGLSATLSVKNLFDERPPAILSNIFGVSYDATNADALGRYVALDLVQRW